MSLRLADGRGDEQIGSAPAECDPDWRRELRRQIESRTHGRVLGLEIEVKERRLIVHGRSRSYYAKQLACAAALDLVKILGAPILTGVELDIEVLGDL